MKPLNGGNNGKLFAKNFLQVIHDLGHGVRLDHFFLLLQDVKLLGERFVGDARVQIERLGLDKRDGLNTFQQGLILAADSHLIHIFAYARFEGGGELIGGLSLEVIDGGGFISLKNLAGVIEKLIRTRFGVR